MSHRSKDHFVDRREIIVDVWKRNIDRLQTGQESQQAILTHRLHNEPISVPTEDRLLAWELEVTRNPDCLVHSIAEKTHRFLS
jgi:hypothetical protein